MPPRITSIQAKARDAFAHTLDSARARTFGNESSGSAALPAPYHAFVARTLAGSSHSSSTPQEVTHAASRASRLRCLRGHRLG
jgi:hypothetical protein